MVLILRSAWMLRLLNLALDVELCPSDPRKPGLLVRGFFCS